MNKIDGFFVMASLLLVWLFAIWLLPYKIMMFVYPALAAWWVGTTIANIPRKLAKETDRDMLEEMFETNKELVKVAEGQSRVMHEMLQCLKIADAAAHALMARIDELMFEYCPEDMTPEQIANYEVHVRAVSQQQEEEIEMALRH